ncbi:MAG: MFS transporter [Actinomycetota bacterium]|nr:MFS transporter [Actinomycetota bacterium]
MSAALPSSRLSFLWSFRGPSRVLHLSTLAFFLSFLVWFDMAPFASAIREDLGLTESQMVTLTLCNLALTVPARVLVVAALERFGPRRLFAGLLVFAAVPNTLFAVADSYGMLVASRLLVGVVGAGFVVGIRQVSMWFPAKQLGTAEGVYGGWGNFGSAAAALALPGLATVVASGESAWRWGIGAAGLVAAAYGVVFWFAVDDAPALAKGPGDKRSGTLLVPNRRAVWGLLALQVPVAGALGLVVWRIRAVGGMGTGTLVVAIGLILAYLGWQARTIVRANRPALTGSGPVPGYPFRSVVLLSLAYGVTFGAELTVVSLLPTFFADTFGLSIGAAGAAGSAFAFTNLVTRPGGGMVSDVTGDRRRWVRVALLGTAATFVLLAVLGSGWPLPLGIGVVALASVFVQGGNGSVFAMVPLVHKPSSGPIAGLAGSYGNVGGIVFSSILFFTHDDAQVLFLVVAAVAVVVAGLCRWLPDVDGVERVEDRPAPSSVPAPVDEPALAAG